jgi:hypothetical protein
LYDGWRTCRSQGEFHGRRGSGHSKDLQMIEATAPQRFKTYDAKAR